MSDRERTRRYKLLRIDYDILIELVQGKWRIKGMPSDIHVIGVEKDFCTHSWLICIEHPTFPEVPEGREIPRATSFLLENDHSWRQL